MFEGLKSLFARKSSEQRSFEPFDTATNSFGNASASNAGVWVSSDNALSVSTLKSIVGGISSPVAMMPRTVEQISNGKSVELKYHNLSYLISLKPNPYMTTYQYHEFMMMNLLLWGNHYTYPKVDLRGNIIELFPLQPIYVQPFAMSLDSGALRIDQLFFNGDIIYRWMAPEMGVEWIPRSMIFHVMGLSKNGIYGLNPIEYAREDVGLSLAGRMAAALSFSQGTYPGGVLECPEKLEDKAFDRLKAAAERQASGLQNVGKPMVLEQGTKWNWNTLDNVKLQSLESRKFQKLELCSLYNYPPYKVGEMERANFANNEQQDTEFLYNCLLSWITRIDLCENTQLLTKAERQQGIYIRTHYQDFLKGDSAARSNYNQKAITTGWLTPNEARASEGMDRSDDPEADKLHFPLNLGNPTDKTNQVEPVPAETGKDVKK